jgi:Flp pilus assembly protein TadB
MEQQNNNSSAGCLDILMAALAILFIALRLTHVINWAWYWVLAPIWAWILIYVGYIVIGVWMATRKYRNKNKGQR